MVCCLFIFRAHHKSFFSSFCLGVRIVKKCEGKMVRTDENIDEIEKKRDEMTPNVQARGWSNTYHF